MPDQYLVLQKVKLLRQDPDAPEEWSPLGTLFPEPPNLDVLGHGAFEYRVLKGSVEKGFKPYDELTVKPRLQRETKLESARAKN